MVKKIALEEHFLDPATEPYWRPTMVDVAPAKTAQLYASLTDFGEQRLQMMDKAGIARAVLAIAGPGVQTERDTATAVRAARASNDFLAKELQKRPDRYSGFAHLAMQDAKAAADELERCVRELKFCGAMINGHTNGKYLDDRSYDPFWERAAALDAPIYLHPADPVAPLPAIAGYLRRRLPPFPESQAATRTSWRDAAVPAMALRQPLGALWLEFAKTAVAISQGERLGNDLGYVRSPAGALLARCTGARPRHVLRRLSF